MGLQFHRRVVLCEAACRLPICLAVTDPHRGGAALLGQQACACPPCTWLGCPPCAWRRSVKPPKTQQERPPGQQSERSFVHQGPNLGRHQRWAPSRGLPGSGATGCDGEAASLQGGTLLPVWPVLLLSQPRDPGLTGALQSGM